jgi:hypothetical protein
MNTDVYVSISDQRGRVIIDGDLQLLAEFLGVMRRGLLPADPTPAEPPAVNATGQHETEANHESAN